MNELLPKHTTKMAPWPGSDVKGFSLIELLIVVVIVGIVAAIAVPNLLASRISANEASALKSLRTTSSNQLVYYSTFGNGSYGTAAQLYSRELMDPTVAAACNVNVGGDPPRNMAKSGYRFRISAVAGDPTAGVTANYVMSANPATVSGVTQTGSKRMCVRDDGILKSSTANLGTRYNYNQCGFAPEFLP